MSLLAKSQHPVGSVSMSMLLCVLRQDTFSMNIASLVPALLRAQAKEVSYPCLDALVQADTAAGPDAGVLQAEQCGGGQPGRSSQPDLPGPGGLCGRSHPRRHASACCGRLLTACIPCCM